MARKRHNTKRQILKAKQSSTPNYVPTPEQIAQGCRTIRSTWTEGQERRARGIFGGAPVFEMPTLVIRMRRRRKKGNAG